MSRIRADRVTDRAGTGPVEITYGANITGVTTAAHLNVTGITTVTTLNATTLSGDGSNLTGIVNTGKAIAMSMIFG